MTEAKKCLCGDPDCHRVEGEDGPWDPFTAEGITRALAASMRELDKQRDEEAAKLKDIYAWAVRTFPKGHRLHDMAVDGPEASCVENHMELQAARAGWDAAFARLGPHTHVWVRCETMSGGSNLFCTGCNISWEDAQ